MRSRPAESAGAGPAAWVTSAGGTVHHAILPRRGLLQAVASLIVDRHRHLLPDLSSVTVVLPGVQAASEFARILVAESRCAALTLPTITTFGQLAEAQPVPHALISDVRRQLTLFSILRDQAFLDPGLLWQATGELSRLMDELSRHRIGLAPTLEAFTEKLARYYGMQVGRTVQFEARVAFEAWRHLAGEPDAAFIYSAGLSRAAECAQGELWVLDPAELLPVEQEFIGKWNARQPVRVIRGVTGMSDDARDAVLHSAWSADRRDSLKVRAARLRDRTAMESPVWSIALCGTPSLEAQAGTADLRIRHWLAQGTQRIAIVAFDRVAARRLRALLERVGVLVQDETGWTLSTVAASTVIARWLDCVTGDFHHRDLLDLTKSPYLFTDWPERTRKAAIVEIERGVRSRNLVSGLQGLRGALGGGSTGLPGEQAVSRLLDAARSWPAGRRSAGKWLDALERTLETLGVRAGLAQDAAGRQVLDRLQSLRDAVEGDKVLLSLAEWRQWLDTAFESALFRDRDIRSPVIITHLGAARGRVFEAVLLLGADVTRLPAAETTGLFLNDNVRSELGLPTSRQRRRVLLDDLEALVADAGDVFAVWQSEDAGEPVPMSPWLELLDTLHEEVFGGRLIDDRWFRRWLRDSHAVPDVSEVPVRTRAPAPVAGIAATHFVSVSAYGALIACPYRYFAAELLRLQDLEALREDLEKREYGELVHRILDRFHRRFPLMAAEDGPRLQQELKSITGDVFAEAAHRDPLARAWERKWRKHIPAYLQFQREREDAGWRWADSEVSRAADIALDDGGTVRLHGRIDRIDERRDGDVRRHTAVLDYKTRARKSLQDALKAGSDVQLACYAILEPDATHAAYVCIDDREVVELPLTGEAGAAARLEIERLRRVFTDVRAGVPLPANGDESACRYCEMRGLCRKDHWNDP
ncbi:MAG: PD-(D/E)XK nuclease family protein [Betaproteobacteria bacterium]|nr:PD-(D/E)XK nuclease family protein [Betaproteobacteria bacterium]